MKEPADRISYTALFVTVAIFIAACAHLELSKAATGHPFTVRSVPNAHLNDAAQYVSDPANLLPPRDKAEINRLAASLNARFGIETAVVVVKDVGDNDAREFATDLFNYWGLGKKDKDNGLLILLVTDPPQRSVIFETGYGLEGILPDAITFRLQQRYMVPDFKDGKWGEGLVSGMRAVAEYLTADPQGREHIAPPVAREKREEDISPLSTWLVIVGFFVLLFLLRRNPAALGLILGSLSGGRRGPGRRGGGGSWGGGASGGGGSMSRF